MSPLSFPIRLPIAGLLVAYLAVSTGCMLQTPEDAPNPEDADSAEEEAPLNRSFELNEDCAPIQEESAWCFTTGHYPNETVQAVGLDSGEVCEISTFEGIYAQPNMAANGDVLVLCQGLPEESEAISPIAFVDILTGQVTRGDAPCDFAIHRDGGIQVGDFYPAGDTGSTWYATAQDAGEGTNGVDTPFRFEEHHTAMDGDIAYAIFRDDTVEVVDVQTNDMLDVFPLQGFDGTMDGVSAPGNGVLYVLEDGIIDDNPRIVRFDAATGERLGMRKLVGGPPRMEGLDCFVND